VHGTSPVEEAHRNALLRSLPSIDDLLSRPLVASALAHTPRPRVVAALRTAVAAVRARILESKEPRGLEDSDLEQALVSINTPRLRPVLNATGVVLHTNLGRAPLAAVAVERVAQIARGYSTLEYDLEEGERGSRYAPVVNLLRGLCGAQSAIVVNNNAAAVLLVLSALSANKGAVVSRGELVEIGGGFRIPDVMRQSGARLVEVGTTNRTRLSDYAEALDGTPDAALLVKVHKSNFAVVGFSEETSTQELVGLAQQRGVLVYEDLGSGSLVRSPDPLLASEPTVEAAVRSGVDVVTFSGDKLLGGPQAGIIVGREDVLCRIRAHPLNRALRVDKLTVAALEATLELYRDERFDELPTWRMLHASPSVLRARAERLESLLRSRGVEAAVHPTSASVGGGALPLSELPSFACALKRSAPLELQQALRKATPPVIARVAEGSLLLDVRCLQDDELESLADAVRASISGETP
jgi:L-seryl-tRNA(Ser) seleniumtransferase